MLDLEKVYSRITVHREAIRFIKYLPSICIFLSVCDELNLKFWRLNYEEKRVQILFDFKLTKKIKNVVVLGKNYQSTREKFMLIFKKGESEMFEFDAEEDKLYYIETEKIREHDCTVKGVDFNIPL